MCYKCAKIQFIIALSAAATSLGDIVGGEDAQRSICNVVNEVADGLANDLADERKAEAASSATVPDQAEASCGQATEVRNENGSGDVAEKQPSDALLAYLMSLAIRKNPLKD